jgi:hypothetical protein
MVNASVEQRPIRAGVFDSILEADCAVNDLLAAGFTKDEITVVCSDEHKERFFRDFEHQDPAGTSTVESAVIGGVIGAALGGAVTLAGVVASGGIGLLVAGAIVTWTGGAAGTLIGAMMSRGVEGELANFYDQAVVAGKILVAADDQSHQPQRLAKAEQILARAGAKPLPLPEG